MQANSFYRTMKCFAIFHLKINSFQVFSVKDFLPNTHGSQGTTQIVR